MVIHIPTLILSTTYIGTQLYEIDVDQGAFTGGELETRSYHFVTTGYHFEQVAYIYLKNYNEQLVEE